MTNERILQSDILDILFMNRNKDYGAYALRRGYNHRLFVAISIAISVILVFVIVSLAMGKKESSVPITKNDRIL